MRGILLSTMVGVVIALTWMPVTTVCGRAGEAADAADATDATEATEAKPGRFEFHGQEMAASVKIVLYAADEDAARRASDAAFARIREVNSRLNAYDPESELSRLSRDGAGPDAAKGGALKGGVAVGDDLWRVLARADEISRASGGAFDVTVGPLVRLWREARRRERLPDAELLAEARGLVGHALLERDPAGRTVRLARPGMLLDLGAIAKGYAADEALAAMRGLGTTRVLVEIGGDIALGDPPPDADGWRIGVLPHEGEGTPMRYLSLSMVGVATSGDREQFVVIDGRRYSHIVDPRTGLGLEDNSSVTVVAPDAMTADAVASAASVLGPAKGLDLIEGSPGCAGRIVRSAAGGPAVFESRGWKALVGADPAAVTSADVESPAPAPAPDPGPALPAAPGLPAPPPADPTVTPCISWMLEPVSLPEASARSEAEMNRYTERIPATEVTFDMVPIPGGRFLLGSPPDEPQRGDDEGPQVEVEIEPFWMGKHEVTWEEYELWAMGYDALRREGAGTGGDAWDRLADAITRPTKPYSDMTFGMGKTRCPAICMSHLAARVYTKWLSAKTGRYYRLPTEAEWEYACRAGTTTAYSFGDDPKDLGDHAWYFENSLDAYHEVGKKKPNPWGLHDMHGNVDEWVSDGYVPDAYGGFVGEAARNPLVVPASLYPRAVRGGSWYDDADRCRSAARRGSHMDWNMGDPQMPKSPWYLTEGRFVGFRLVRPLRVPTPEEAERHDLDEAQKGELADYLEYLSGRH